MDFKTKKESLVLNVPGFKFSVIIPNFLTLRYHEQFVQISVLFLKNIKS